MKEPLFHFVALGAALFLLFSWMDNPAGSGDDRIVVTPGRIEHLAAGFQRTWQRAPTEQELQGLIDSYIREEIYYREALALGLDQDDAIVRRRMTQKLEFLTADAAEALEPSDDELRAYLEEHPDAFRVEPQAAFRHVYVNPERHAGDAGEIAMELLRRLQSGGVSAEDVARLGDRLMLPDALPLSRRSEIERMFGREFADSVLKAAPGRWNGPIASGYGLHLVYVSERREARLPALDEVRDVVLREWLNDRREKMGEAFYERLRERYTVVVEMPESRSAEGGDDVDSLVEAQ